MSQNQQKHANKRAYAAKGEWNYIHDITQYQPLSPPPPKMMMGDNLQSQILEGGRSEKNEYLGGLKESLPQMFTRGVTMFLVKKIL